MMGEAKYPLLVFPAPARAARAKGFVDGGKAKMPNAASQTAHLVPQLQRLQEAMDRQRIALQE